MSFGYAVGDAVAIAGLIERIVCEVRSYKSAPLHFQRLAIELNFLSQVCTQVFQLEPSCSSEKPQIERIRAIALQCLGPLKAFENKMKTYENTLGSGIQNGGWRKKKRWNHFKKQIHWSAVARHDADELRAVLTSEILAINTLLTMQEWTCLKETRSEHQSHAEQLRKLISTTENASREITQFLVDAKAISERLEQLIKEQKMTSEQQIKMLSSMEDRSEQSWSLLQRLARWQESCSASLKEAMENAGTQLVQFIDMKSYLEEWMQKLVQFCKDIIEMVQRNTQLLLSLHSMLARIEAMLTQARIDLPILKLENPFGITVALPFQICDSWEGLHRMLVVMFWNKPGCKLVEDGKFLITHSRTGEIVSPQLWTACVAAGDMVSMSIVLQQLARRPACPRCRHPTLLAGAEFHGDKECSKCRLRIGKIDAKLLPLAASSTSETSEIPIPQPEFLSSTAWNGKWTSGYLRNHIVHDAISFKPPGTSTDADDETLLSLATTPETTFRRVHLIPYQGDILAGVIKVGQECRDLMFRYAQDTLADGMAPFLAQKFEADFDNVLEELEELRAKGIAPLVDLQKRGSRPSHLAFEEWIGLTTRVLLNMPARKTESFNRIQKLGEWLSYGVRTHSGSGLPEHPHMVDERNRGLRWNDKWVQDLKDAIVAGAVEAFHKKVQAKEDISPVLGILERAEEVQIHESKTRPKPLQAQTYVTTT